MQNQIQIFKNKQFGQLEVLTVDGKPYFPATECATVLGYANPQEAIRKHCKKDGCVNHSVIDRLKRNQEKRYISEGNLYRLIIRSKLPAAERFEAWVFDEVLPTIRKHGGYVTDELLKRLADKDEEMTVFLNALREERANREVLEDVVTAIAPKARYCDIILQCESVIPISIIAKDYGMTAAYFNKLLNTIGVQYKIKGTWLLSKMYCKQGYTVSKTFYVGDNKTRIHTYWTQKGRKFIYDYLKLFDILPEIEKEQGF